MPIETNFYSTLQGPDIAGGLQKGMQLKSMMNENKLKAQAITDQQDVRDAYGKGSTVGPDGQVSFDKAKTLSYLGSKNPYQAQLVGKDIAQNERDTQKAQLEQHMQTLNIVGQLAGGVTDQQSLDAMRAHATAMRLPLDGVPTVWDANAADHFKGLQTQAMQAKDQIEAKHKELSLANDERRTGIEDKRANAEITANQLKANEQKTTKSNQNNQETINLLESMRGNPAVQQAEKDIYASQKVNTLYKQVNGNPNPQMAKLMLGEVAKIAQGGAPTMHELDGLDPKLLSGPLASAYQTFTGNPTPAGMQNFMKDYKQYADSVAEDARGMVKDRYGRIIQAKSGSLAPDQISNLTNTYINRFDQPGETKKQTSGKDAPPIDFQNPAPEHIAGAQAELERRAAAKNKTARN